MDIVATQKRDLAQHERVVHEGVNYSCMQCNYQETRKVRAIHEGVKYSCRQRNHQTTTKGDLAQHKRAVHGKVKYSCTQCDKEFSRKIGVAKQRESKQSDAIPFHWGGGQN